MLIYEWLFSETKRDLFKTFQIEVTQKYLLATSARYSLLTERRLFISLTKDNMKIEVIGNFNHFT